jgi:hypothetical protein
MEIVLNHRIKWISLFAILSLSIVLVEYFIVQTPNFYETNSMMPLAVSIDLVVILPILYYFLIIKKLNTSWLSLIGAISISLIIAYVILPNTHQNYLHYVEKILIFCELVLLLYVIIKIRSIYKSYFQFKQTSFDFIQNIQNAFFQHVGNNLFVRILLSELILLRYGLFCWLGDKNEKNTEYQNFTIYKESGFVGLFLTILFVAGIEAFVVHLIVVKYNWIVAWITTALSLYSILFLIAHLIAVQRRVISIHSEMISIRIGFIWNFEIPFSNILEIQKINDIPQNKKNILNLSSALMTSPNTMITLKEPIKVYGLYGINKISHYICLNVDEVNRWIEVYHRDLKKV